MTRSILESSSTARSLMAFRSSGVMCVITATRPLRYLLCLLAIRESLLMSVSMNANEGYTTRGEVSSTISPLHHSKRFKVVY